MSEEEVEIFHGDRPPEHAEGVKKAKPKASTIIAKADPAATAAPAEAFRFTLTPRVNIAKVL